MIVLSVSRLILTMNINSSLKTINKYYIKFIKITYFYNVQLFPKCKTKDFQLDFTLQFHNFFISITLS